MSDSFTVTTWVQHVIEKRRSVKKKRWRHDDNEKKGESQRDNYMLHYGT